MGVTLGPNKINVQDLASYFDAANPDSYPTTGTIWGSITGGYMNLSGCAFTTINAGGVAFDGVVSYATVYNSSPTGDTTIELVINHSNYGLNRHLAYKDTFNIKHQGSIGDNLYFVRLTNNTGATFGDSLWSGYTGIYVTVTSGLTTYITFSHNTTTGVFKSYKNGALFRTTDGFYNNSTGLSTGYGGLNENNNSFYLGYPS